MNHIILLFKKKNKSILYFGIIKARMRGNYSEEVFGPAAAEYVCYVHA